MQGARGEWKATRIRLANSVIWALQGSGAPSNGTTGANIAGPGSLYIRTSNGAIYANTNTKASPTWTQLGSVSALTAAHIFVGNVANVGTDVAMSGDISIDNAGATAIGANKVLPTMVDATVVKVVEVTIPAADIVDTTAGKFGHAAGQEIVAAPGAGKVIEFLSAVVVYDQAVKAYTGGGDVTVNYSGGDPVSNTLVKTEFAAHNGDTVNALTALDTANGIPLPVNTGLSLVAAAAFTQPDTAAGVVRVRVSYRVHATGL